MRKQRIFQMRVSTWRLRCLIDNVRPYAPRHTTLHPAALWHRTLISHSQVTAERSFIDVRIVFVNLSNDCNSHIQTAAIRPAAQLEDTRRLRPRGVFDDARDGIHVCCQDFN
jgi:hypothetical protein